MTHLPAALPLVPPELRFRWLVPVGGLILTAAASVVSLWIAGPLQGVAFASVLLIILVVPAQTVGSRTTLVTLTLSLAVGIAANLGPAIALRDGLLNTRTFIPTAAVVLSLSFATAGLCLLLLLLSAGSWRTAISALTIGPLAGVVASAAIDAPFLSWTPLLTVGIAGVLTFAMLTLIRYSAFAAAWVVSVLLLAWLTWPIWLSPWLPGREAWVDVLSPAHPLLSLDAALVGENVPPWTEHRLMYGRLTVLQQHVMSRPPHDVLATILLNLALALPGFAATGIVEIVSLIRSLKSAAKRPQVEPAISTENPLVA